MDITPVFDYSVTIDALNLNTDLVLVNKQFKLNENYIPDDLVYIDTVDTINDKFVCNKVLTAYKQLYYDALKDDIKLVVFSAFRSYKYQDSIYVGNDDFSARPGHSEHQTGLALDVSTREIGLNQQLGNYKEGIWIKENAYKYGFTIRYPHGKENITGYQYEPWHIRYVGKSIAKHLYDNNLTLEEYLL